MNETMTSGLTLELWYHEKPDQSGFYCYLPLFGKPADEEGSHSGSGFTLEEAEEDFFRKYNQSHALDDLKYREEESDDDALLGKLPHKIRVDIECSLKRGKIHLTQKTWDRVHSAEGTELKEYFMKFLKNIPLNEKI